MCCQPRFAHIRWRSLLLAGLFGLFVCRSGLAFCQNPGSPTTDPTELKASTIRGLEFGFRAGYGFNLSTCEGCGDPGKLIPLWADLGYRIHPNWYVGAFFQYAILQFPDSCQHFASPVSCSGNDLRFGVNVHYHLRPNRRLDPWAGIGAGYEIAHWETMYTRDTYSVEFSGFELNLQVGLDCRVFRTTADRTLPLGIGPFVALTIAQYSNESAKLSGYSKTHEWLMLGVRGVFDLILD